MFLRVPKRSTHRCGTSCHHVMSSGRRRDIAVPSAYLIDMIIHDCRQRQRHNVQNPIERPETSPGFDIIDNLMLSLASLAPTRSQSQAGGRGVRRFERPDASIGSLICVSPSCDVKESCLSSSELSYGWKRYIVRECASRDRDVARCCYRPITWHGSGWTRW